MMWAKYMRVLLRNQREKQTKIKVNNTRKLGKKKPWTFTHGQIFWWTDNLRMQNYVRAVLPRQWSQRLRIRRKSLLRILSKTTVQIYLKVHSRERELKMIIRKKAKMLTITWQVNLESVILPQLVTLVHPHRCKRTTRFPASIKLKDKHSTHKITCTSIPGGKVLKITRKKKRVMMFIKTTGNLRFMDCLNKRKTKRIETIRSMSNPQLVCPQIPSIFKRSMKFDNWYEFQNQNN